MRKNSIYKFEINLREKKRKFCISRVINSHYTRSGLFATTYWYSKLEYKATRS